MGAVLVAGAQANAAVVDLLWGGGAWQRGHLCPGQRGETVPPQAAGGGVLALASSEKQHAVSVGHSRVAHEPGRAGPETTGSMSGSTREITGSVFDALIPTIKIKNCDKSQVLSEP